MEQQAKYVTDLFGEVVPLPEKKKKRGKRPVWKSVATKLSKEEYDELCTIAGMFGCSVFRYVHDAVVQAMKDHECILLT